MAARPPGPHPNRIGDLRPGAVQPSEQNYPQRLIRDRFPVIPHVLTFAGKWNVVNQTYAVYFDEALRDSQANTLAMRRDFFVHSMLQHRKLPVVCLPWHVQVDDPEHPDQKAIASTLEAIIKSIPRLKTLKLYLLEAIFYGKYGAQIVWGPAVPPATPGTPSPGTYRSTATSCVSSGTARRASRSTPARRTTTPRRKTNSCARMPNTSRTRCSARPSS